MIPFFIFNGINSKDRGIIVNSLPSISKAKRRYEEIEVPGRNGNLYIDDESFEPFEYEITCTMMPEAEIRTLSSWLEGSGKLILSSELDKFYNVFISDQIDYEQVYRVCNKFVVHFKVQPIALSVKEKVLYLNQESSINLKNFTYNTYPYIKVEGSGKVTLIINNSEVVINEIQNYIELDCELEEAFKGEMNCNSSIECIDFPKLKPGINTISWLGTVTLLTIKYREAFL